MIPESQASTRRRRRTSSRRKRLGRPAFIAILACMLLMAGGIAVFLTHERHASTREDLTSAAEALVQIQIPESVRAVFSPPEETAVEPQSGDKYLVQGWVDLIQSEGTIERQTFSCVVYRNTWGDWVGEKVALMEQM